MGREEFYDKCDTILGIEHTYNEPVKKRNRWNTRRIGNGRFPGFGLVRYYGPTSIIIISKQGTKHLTSVEDAFKILEQFKDWYSNQKT